MRMHYFLNKHDVARASRWPLVQTGVFMKLLTHTVNFLIASMLLVGCFEESDLDIRESAVDLNIESDTLKSIATQTVNSVIREGNFYYCTGMSSKSYHARRDCKGLSNCQGIVTEILEGDLKKNNRIDPCNFCIK